MSTFELNCRRNRFELVFLKACRQVETLLTGFLIVRLDVGLTSLCFNYACRNLRNVLWTRKFIPFDTFSIQKRSRKAKKQFSCTLSHNNEQNHLQTFLMEPNVTDLLVEIKVIAKVYKKKCFSPLKSSGVVN